MKTNDWEKELRKDWFLRCEDDSNNKTGGFSFVIMSNDEHVIADWWITKIRTLLAEAGDTKPPRCKKCNSPFLPHHKIHTMQDVGGFYHTGCMPSLKAGDTKSGCCGKCMMALPSGRMACDNISCPCHTKSGCCEKCFAPPYAMGHLQTRSGCDNKGCECHQKSGCCRDCSGYNGIVLVTCTMCPCHQNRGRWVTCEDNHIQGCAHWHFESCVCPCHEKRD